MLDIVIATGNPHKFHELVKLIRVSGVRWHSLKEFPHIRPAEESGRTFDANAVKKARVIAKATGFYAIADDSGIEVNALDGAPGVRSARFAGAHGNDAANNKKLLRLMEKIPARHRGARYVCSLALVSPNRIVAVTRGKWNGTIALAARGTGGFGYDPVVIIPGTGKTVAQLPKQVKRQYSHRSAAVRAMLPVLKRLVLRLKKSH